MKYLNKFETRDDYNNATLTLPAVSLINEDYSVNYDPVLPVITAGMICYATNEGMLKFCSRENWYASLGTPVGVCVIPSNHTSDNTARIISLDGVDADGNHSNTEIAIEWGVRTDAMSLQNFKHVVTWNNSEAPEFESSSEGFLPSDDFTGDECITDPKAHYSWVVSEQMIPSAYLPDGTLNTNYKVTTGIFSDNMLSDFNGSSNTLKLINATGPLKCPPADMCNAYAVGDVLPAYNWYLPACGELGYTILRRKEINNSLEIVNGVLFGTDTETYWSSTEYSRTNAVCISTHFGKVEYNIKSQQCYVRPFASILITPFSI